jgi:hypothetical protein
VTTTFPDFYLVGAPKCGTTAMYDFLQQHPDLFLPDEKELLYFGSDLSYPSRLSRDQYLEHFSSRSTERSSGTAHTAYLQSRDAAKEIAAERPDAKIIIMLRNPVEMLASWHSELLYETIEDIEDFEEALDAEPSRRRGEHIPRGARKSYVESLFYTDVAAFAEQVERYLEVFGGSRVHVILHDDLTSDPSSAYVGTLSFLGVDPTFVPDFATLNANKVARSRLVQRVYYATSTPGHAAVKRLIPSAVRQRLLALNRREEPRSPTPDHVRDRIRSQLADDVTRLSALLGRDLSGWPGQRVAST